MKKTRAGMFLAVCLCSMTLLTACGMDKDADIDTGMADIAKLDYQSALSCFEKALVNNEDAELLYRGQGIAYIGLTQYDKAAESFEKALSNGNGQVGNLEYDINYYLATAYYKSGQTDKAIKVYDAILALRPKEREALYLRGSLHLEKKDLTAANKDFKEAVRLDPKDYSMLIDIYSILKEKEQEKTGRMYLSDAMKADTKSMSDFDRGRLYYYMQDYENAKTYLEKARTQEGAEAVLYLGRTYEALGDYNYASSVYANYVDDDKTRPEIYNQLGLCKINMGDYKGALEAFEAGLSIEGNSYLQDLKFNEIVAYEYLNNYKKATVLMESYLKTYPDDAKAKREYEFLKTR